MHTSNLQNQFLFTFYVLGYCLSSIDVSMTFFKKPKSSTVKKKSKPKQIQKRNTKYTSRCKSCVLRMNEDSEFSSDSSEDDVDDDDIQCVTCKCPFRQSAKYCSVLKSLCPKCHQAYKNVQHLQIDGSLDDNNESSTNTSIVEEEGNKFILKLMKLYYNNTMS
jgi:hypothetical protein